MKIKNFNKKLVFNKKTVADLRFQEMDDVKGGGLTDPFTACGDWCSVQMCTGITCGPCAYTVVGCETEVCSPGIG